MILLLIYISTVDFFELIIPNSILLSGAIVSLAFNTTGNGVGFLKSISGCITMVVFTYIIALIMKKIFKEECIGYGDVKLFGMIGLFLGFDITFIIFIASIYLASFIGTSYVLYSKFKFGEYNKLIPFAPVISLATLFVLLIK
ncbi:A24 family peptidase [Metaclostridioides mangenotii]|uniref:prepilin peptidase n=1 Tax=Metaclostridioides mangenotii TaxID=1540 RepID=UPI00048616C2|nr:A24 family peptidase [Clostridioides mangenotii]